MATGRVLQFDQARGYGFVAAEDGGEDVFLHASVFDGDSSELVPGMLIEFEVMAGDRGRKAYAAHLAPGEPGDEVRPAEVVAGGPAAADEEQLCDVLSAPEFSQEITEMLLNVVPAVRGDHILEIRQGMLEFARKHGWVDV
jgi:cold shock protein